MNISRWLLTLTAVLVVGTDVKGDNFLDPDNVLGHGHTHHMTWEKDTVTILVHDHGGNLDSEKLSRIGETVDLFNAIPARISIKTTTNSKKKHQIHFHEDATSLCGAFPPVLGCAAYAFWTADQDPQYDDGHFRLHYAGEDVSRGPFGSGIAEATIISDIGPTYSWYTGPDSGPIGANQFDWVTVLRQEWAHLLGLDHSGDPTSVMQPFLSAATILRNFTDHDQDVYSHINAATGDGGGGGGGPPPGRGGGRFLTHTILADPSVIPEPASLSLLAFSSLLVLWPRRNWRKGCGGNG